MPATVKDFDALIAFKHRLKSHFLRDSLSLHLPTSLIQDFL